VCQVCVGVWQVASLCLWCSPAAASAAWDLQACNIHTIHPCNNPSAAQQTWARRSVCPSTCAMP
jgi:hypothetical protein